MRRLLPLLVLALGACGGGTSGSASVSTSPGIVSMTVDPGANGAIRLPDGSVCRGMACTISAATGSSIHLTAEQALRLRFDFWTQGPCQGSTAVDCTFTATSGIAVQGRFSTLVFVDLSFSGFGHGSIVQGAQSFRDNASLLLAPDDGCLHAVPDPGSSFAGWAGASGEEATVDAAGDLCLGSQFSVQIKASFLLQPVPGQFVVRAGMIGAGHGRISSVPEGIDFETTAEGAFVVRKSTQAEFQPSTTVVLEAVAATGSRFAGWTGDCTGPGKCVLTGAGSAIALFAVDLLEARYDVEDLGDISAVGNVGGIGPDGTVFGAAAGPGGHTVAFIAHDSIELLPLGDGHDSAATGVNKSGVVVGWLGFEPQSRGDPGRPMQAFRFASGNVQLLSDSPGPSAALGINDAGVIAVTAPDGAFIWDGSLRALPGTAAGCVAGEAAAISSNGIVAGALECPAAPGELDVRAALFEGGAAHDVSAAARPSSARAVNAKGQAIVVDYDLNTSFWDGAAAHPAPDGYFFNFLDDQGHLTGRHQSKNVLLDQTFAVLFENGQPVNLNALVDAPQWTIRSAAGVDEQGRIGAVGELSPLERHALRLVPRR